jgi:hypothetical protein
MAASQSNEKIVLNGPDDWEVWSTQFQAKAVASELWDLIDPDLEQRLPFAKKPPPPKVEDYDKRRIQRETRSASSSTATSAAQEEEVDIGVHPKNAAEMTTVARAAFQLDWSMYTHNSRLYTQEKEAIEKLKGWVLKTVSNHLIRTACSPTESIDKWYEKLQTQVGVTEGKQRRDARESYKSAIKPMNKPPKDMLAWLATWEEAISLAQEKKVPEAIHPSEWFEDFAAAVKNTGVENWVTSYRMLHKNDIEAGNLTFRELANDFGYEVRLTHGNGSRRTIAKGAFGPSFAGKDHQLAAEDALDQGDEETQAEGKGKKKKGAGKRKYTGGSQSGCPACDLTHPLSECYYVFPERAPKWFRFRPETEEKVKKAMEDNDQLRSEIEKLKAKKKKEKEKKGDD